MTSQIGINHKLLSYHGIMVFWNSGRFVLPIILLGLLEFYHYPITLFVMYCELCNIECVKVFPGSTVRAGSNQSDTETGNHNP